MAKFNIVLQHPKPSKKPIPGFLSIDQKGEAHFFSGEGEKDSTLIAQMERVHVEFAAKKGIMLSGMERVSTTKNGTGKYRYQSWWLAYPS